MYIYITNLPNKPSVQQFVTNANEAERKKGQTQLLFGEMPAIFSVSQLVPKV
jgi:hypothetical protein